MKHINRPKIIMKKERNGLILLIIPYIPHRILVTPMNTSNGATGYTE
jgi:hypothetical protein